MSSSGKDQRARHFASNCLAWAVVRHFLDASLLRELAETAVGSVGGGEVSLDRLFEEVVPSGPAELGTWILRPKRVSSGRDRDLQACVLALVRTGGTMSGQVSGRDAAERSDSLSPRDLWVAIELGGADLGRRWSADTLDCIASQPSFRALLEAMRRAGEGRDAEFPQAVSALDALSEVDQPLRAVIVKHIGDLFASADDWIRARYFYAQACHIPSESVGECWSGFVSTFRGILEQSIAAAEAKTLGAREASVRLREIASLGLAHEPLRAINAAPDSLALTLKAGDDRSGLVDNRGVVVEPPLLGPTHSVSRAVLAASSRNHLHHAQLMFWETLRRQIALGVVAASDGTRAQFGKFLIGSTDAPSGSGRPAFHAGTRLLIEGGDAIVAEQVDWPRPAVEAYLDDGALDLALSTSRGVPGAAEDREAVLVVVLEKWLDLIPPDRTGLARAILGHLLSRARGGEGGSAAARRTANKSREALAGLALRRPEFRKLAASDVVPLITAAMRSGFGIHDGHTLFGVALAFASAFDPDALRDVVRAVLDAFDRLTPEASAWVIVRPAVQLLVSKDTKEAARHDATLRRRIAEMVLRFGLGQESEAATLIFALRDFDPPLLNEPEVVTRLRPAIEDLREVATNIRRSDVVDKIVALLLAPAASGRSGVQDALSGLREVIRSSATAQPSIAISQAYEPLILLAAEKETLAAGLSLDEEEFETWLAPLFQDALDFWRRLLERPSVLAPFSIGVPRAAEPVPATVHNWAYACEMLAASLGRTEDMISALHLAASNPLLRDGIELALLTRALARDTPEIDVESIRSESRLVFYGALGDRMAHLDELPPGKASELVDRLLERCLVLGPHGLDAAILVTAAKLGSSIPAGTRDDYLQRAQADRDLRQSLTPLLEKLSDRPVPR
ncbi:hypothetical protein [Methylobacterium planeticum]|uniref:Uncharacterized protein n=1 Tax=Methylobacterium planeticum TaxID=2615211 RepID=A0A6N6MMD1_9HYPH|nr:hypothetical protein [Methylobacterium planeticum]KAB1070162.1 hypothetical protein F6X51_23630 [Methylobacterium planeticum]